MGWGAAAMNVDRDGEVGGGPDHLSCLNSDNSLNLYHNLISNVEPDDFNQYSDLNIDSLFHDMPSIIKKFSNTCRPLFLNINIQSLNSKYEKLKNFIISLTNKNVSIDLISLQETWTIKHPRLLDIPGFQPLIFSNRLRGRGGGVGFYIRNGINYTINNDLSVFVDKTFESLTLDLSFTTNNSIKHLTVTNIYRSPSLLDNQPASEQMESFHEKFDNLLSNLSNKNVDAYVFLDANINLFNLDNNIHAASYLTNASNSGFILTNFLATRIQNSKASLIDHIFTNSKDSNIISGSIIDDLSDHFMTFLSPNLSRQKTKPKTIKCRHYSKANVDLFKRDLNMTNWDPVTMTNDVDSCYDQFWKIYTDIHDRIFPLTTSRFNKNIHKISEFMTTGLLISRTNKNKLHKIALTDNVPYNWQQYRSYRNIFNKVVKQSKKLHYQKSIECNAKNPKKTWDILKELTTGKKNPSPIEKIKSNGSLLTDPSLIANEFNSFFTKVGRSIADAVEPTTKEASDYIPIPSSPPPNLRLDPISQQQIVDIISAMDSKSSTDANGISMKILKSIKYQLSEPLSHLFSLSISTGVFPSKLKTSKTIPIFKSGDHTSCDNYRPISLLSSISKILEKVVANSLVNHLEINNLLYENQYGFLRGRSTVHNITKLTTKISQDLNEKKFVVGVFLDLKKAFDTVSHDILLLKLQKLGITGLPLAWFSSYLSNRMQYTEINGSKSTELPIDISVLQGSILGPILFLCFINDLHLATLLLTFLFADDTAVVDSDTDLPSLINRINSELQKIANWFRANKMSVNVGKTKYILFRPRGQKIPINLDDNGILFNSNELGHPDDPNKIFKLGRIFNDHPDKNERTYKFLGIHLDEYLSFDTHCSLICNKLARSNFILSRVKNLLPVKSLKTLYFALVHPHLLYCLPIYSCTSNKNLKRISKLQNKAIRLITKSKYNTTPLPLYSELKILPLDLLITLTSGQLIHAIYHKYAPKSLHNLWITNEQREINHDLRDAHLLYVPYARTEHVKKLPFFAFPKIWNELPDFKLTSNPTTFKIALKFHLNSQLSITAN